MHVDKFLKWRIWVHFFYNSVGTWRNLACVHKTKCPQHKIYEFQQFILHCGLYVLLSPRNSVGGDIVTRPFVGGWVSEWVSGWVRACVCVSVTLYLVDTIATTIFAQSLSNFTCKLWMIRGGTLLILGHRVKGQGQLWRSVYKTLWAR